MMLYARLEGQNVVQIDSDEWRSTFNGTQKVQQTRIGKYLVSTVFLAINHSTDEQPHWFETMIFVDDEAHPFHMNLWRCATWHEALTQHEHALLMVLEQNKQTELVCDHCGTDVDSFTELTYTQSIGNLCENCMENRVWK